MIQSFFFLIPLLGFAAVSEAQIEFDDDGVSIVAPDTKKKRKKRRRRSRGELQDSEMDAIFDAWKKPAKKRRKKSFSETAFAREEEALQPKSKEFDWERSPKGSEFLSDGVPQLTGGEWGGEIALEGRAYQQFTSTEDLVDKNLGLFFRVERSFESEDQSWEAKAKAFGRYDSLDPDRNKVFPEDLWLSYARDLFQVRLGFQVFNWSQMDIFNPADLINSVNFDSEIENLEKLGEFALTLKMNLTIGFMELIYMPFVFGSSFPGPKSRLNLLDPGQEMGEPIYLKKDGDLVERTQFHQLALRWSRTFGAADVNLFLIDQIDRRSPEIVFQSSSNQFRPIFFPVLTFGGNALYSTSGNTYKIEMLRRLVSNPTETTIFGDLKRVNHWIGAAGYEREFEIWGEKSLTTFLEYTWVFGLDEGSTTADKLRIGSFQNDLALGFRFSFNDPNNQVLRVLVDVDFDNKEQILASGAYSRRIGENWKVALSYRYIKATPQNSVAVGLEQFDGDSFAEIKLTRFF